MSSDRTITTTGKPPLYHERQRLALCAVHAVNNLLQQPRFSKQDFDCICEALSENRVWNPHRSVLQIGDYDINVVSLILEQEGFSVTWHDQRTDFRDLAQGKCCADGGLVGILWNVPSNSLLGWLMNGRHWIALLKKDDDEWVNLDSVLSFPKVIGTDDACAHLLESKRTLSHVLYVRKKKKDP